MKLASRGDFLKKSAGIASAAGILSLSRAAKALDRDAKLRETLGVKRVDKPTYKVVGTVERFELQENRFQRGRLERRQPQLRLHG